MAKRAEFEQQTSVDRYFDAVDSPLGGTDGYQPFTSNSTSKLGKRQLRSRDFVNMVVDFLVSVLFLLVFFALCYVAIQVIQANPEFFSGG